MTLNLFFTFDAFRNKTENAPINDMSLRYASGIASEHGNGDIFKKWQGFNTLKPHHRHILQLYQDMEGSLNLLKEQKLLKE